MHAISDSDCSSDDDVSVLKKRAVWREDVRMEAAIPPVMVTATASETPAPASETPAPADNGRPPVPQRSPIDLKTDRPICQYGAACYRKNPEHVLQYQHPEKRPATDACGPDGPLPKKTHEGLDVDVADHTEEMSSLFDFYLTTVRDRHSPACAQGGSMSLKDILALPVGDLLESVQFNYMFDLEWLVDQYPTKWRQRPLLLVHGKQREAKAEFQLESEKYSNIKLCQARLEMVYGTHHTKMMMLLYDVGLRIVITTANLIQQDWDQKTQGIWLSPLLPRGNGDSPTNFKKDMLEYLSAYKAPLLQPWIDRLHEHDASAIRVFLVASVPGRHSGEMKSAFGHMRLRKLLQQHVPCSGSDALGACGTSAAAITSSPLVNGSWPVIAQFSSIGSLGGAAEQWLCKEWLTSLAACKPSLGSALLLSPPPRLPTLKLVYPSVENVRTSLEGYPAGGSLPYASETARKQPYLVGYMCQWKADRRGRTFASPHIKTYTRVSPDCSKITWFLLTSANLSKAAWGALEKHKSQLMVRSYELGVLFLPAYFGMGEAFDVEPGAAGFFPLPYDLPLTPYSKTDSPWMVDACYTDKPDRHGRVWKPR